MRYEAVYKNFKMAVRKLQGGWQPEVINTSNGESYGSINGNGIPVAYPQYLTTEEAQEKACQEASRLFGGTERSCPDAVIIWKLVQE